MRVSTEGDTHFRFSENEHNICTSVIVAAGVLWQRRYRRLYVLTTVEASNGYTSEFYTKIFFTASEGV